MYVHQHSESYANAITVKQESAGVQQAALRVFLDAFYYECGFRTWDQSSDFVAGVNPHNDSSDLTGVNIQQRHPSRIKDNYTLRRRYE